MSYSNETTYKDSDEDSTKNMFLKQTESKGEKHIDV